MSNQAEEPEEKPLLVFQWEHRDRTLHWFLAAGIMMILLLVVVSSVFPVFRAERRLEPAGTYEVLLLDRSSPYAQPIIARAADRSFLLLGKRAHDDAEPSLTSIAPVFTPSFKNYDFRLKELPEPEVSTSSFRWLRPTRPQMPEIAELADLPPAGPLPKLPRCTLRAVVTGGLAERRLERQVEVSDAISHEALTISFRAGVGPDGRVLWALPMQQEGLVTAELQRLRRAINRLRFGPKPSAEIEWGEINFQWEAQAEP